MLFINEEFECEVLNNFKMLLTKVAEKLNATTQIVIADEQITAISERVPEFCEFCETYSNEFFENYFRAILKIVDSAVKNLNIVEESDELKECLNAFGITDFDHIFSQVYEVIESKKEKEENIENKETEKRKNVLKKEFLSKAVNESILTGKNLDAILKWNIGKAKMEENVGPYLIKYFEVEDKLNTFEEKVISVLKWIEENFDNINIEIEWFKYILLNLSKMKLKFNTRSELIKNLEKLYENVKEAMDEDCDNDDIDE